MEYQQQQRLWCWYTLLSLVGIVVHAVPDWHLQCRDVLLSDVGNPDPVIDRCARHARWAKNTGVKWKPQWYTNFTDLDSNSSFGAFQCMLFYKNFRSKVLGFTDHWECPFPCTEPKLTIAAPVEIAGQRACPTKCADSTTHLVDFKCIPQPTPPPTLAPTTPQPTPVPGTPTTAPTAPTTAPTVPPTFLPTPKANFKVDEETPPCDNFFKCNPWLWFVIMGIVIISCAALWFAYLWGGLSSMEKRKRSVRGTKLVADEDIEVTETITETFEVKGKGKGQGSIVAPPVAVPRTYYTAGSVNYAPIATSVSVMPQYAPGTMYAGGGYPQ